MNSASALKIFQAQIGRMDCGGYAKTIEVTLQQLSGVAEAKVNFATQRLSVTYGSQQVNEATVRDRVTALGYTIEPIPNQTTQVQTPSTQTLQAYVGGMDCGGCAKTIAANLQQLPGITEATVNFASERLNVIYDPINSRTQKSLRVLTTESKMVPAI